MTPEELAREFGYTELFDVLAPRILTPVPARTLERVQVNFHKLIEEDLGQRVADEHLYLHALEVLTELDPEVMWFEIKFHTNTLAVCCPFLSRISC